MRTPRLQEAQLPKVLWGPSRIAPGGGNTLQIESFTVRALSRSVSGFFVRLDGRNIRAVVRWRDITVKL